MALQQLNQWKCFGGHVRKYLHRSSITNCDMKFSVFLPSVSSSARVPALYWLSGLTCTDDNFIQKAGAFRAASTHGVALVVCDVSPRGCGLPGEKDSWDLGEGAGFYISASQQPWNKHYHMYEYVTNELPSIVETLTEIDPTKKSIFGHSMGGHGALICYLRNLSSYRSVSAFAPICAPSQCPWGHKAFTAYLGADNTQWKQWDATHLLADVKQPVNILVDQGADDEFLHKGQLRPDLLQEAAKQNANVTLEMRMQAGYDHSYFFISTFIDDHIAYHAKYLK